MNRQLAPTAAAPPLDWDSIRFFLAVVDAGSLTGAATLLGISQPTLSRQIRELETRIGSALFERVARGLKLTQAGTALVAPARRMQTAAQGLSLSAIGHTQQLAGAVRLTASEMTSAYLLPQILTELRRGHPEVQVELVVSNRVENLLERQADIAVRHTRPTQSGLIARHLGDLPLGAYAHADYLARVGGMRDKKVDMRRLQDYDWIGYDRSDMMLRGFRQAGIPVTREFFQFRCDNQVVCWHAALTGMGIAIAPRLIARHWPDMHSVLPDDMVPPLPVWLTAHRELRGSARLRLAFDTLAEDLQRLLQP